MNAYNPGNLDSMSLFFVNVCFPLANRDFGSVPYMKSQNASGFSLIEVTIALGILAFVAVSVLGLIPTGLASAQRSGHATVATRLAAEVQAELQQVGLASFSTNTTAFDVDGRIVLDLNGATVSTTPPVYDVYRTVQACPLPGASTGTLQRIVVQVVKNPGRQSLSRGADQLVTVPTGLEERSYQFHVVQ
jgi:uncharacterized protein (TIGR02598 family)